MTRANEYGGRRRPPTILNTISRTSSSLSIFTARAMSASPSVTYVAVSLFSAQRGARSMACMTSPVFLSYSHNTLIHQDIIKKTKEGRTVLNSCRSFSRTSSRSSVLCGYALIRVLYGVFLSIRLRSGCIYFGRLEGWTHSSESIIPFYHRSKPLTFPEAINCTNLNFFSASSWMALGTMPGLLAQISKNSSASDHRLSAARAQPPL